MKKIVIAGAAGRMGRTLVRCTAKFEDLRLAGAVESPGHPDLHKDVGELAGTGVTGVCLTSDLGGVLAAADVVIDFTLHTAVPANAETAAGLGKAMVIGTTGLDAEGTARVHAAARTIPIVWAPNMSLGVNVLLKALRDAAAVFGSAYRVQVDETHHVHKKDAPSGTALLLARQVAEGRGETLEDVMLHDPEGQGSEYPPDRLVVRSFREGEVVGDHTVSFAGDGETIEFTHHAWSREAFATGALRAAQWVIGRPAALYSMQDVLGL